MKTEKFKSVSFNNRKKQVLFKYTSGKKITTHYGELGIKKNITRAWIDMETNRQSVGFEFYDGAKDYMPYDQPLSISKDPEFLLRTHLELMIANIKDELKRRGISKHYLAEQLKTSDNQIQRLLNPSILNKNLEQFYKIFALLGLEFKIKLSRAA